MIIAGTLGKNATQMPAIIVANCLGVAVCLAVVEPVVPLADVCALRLRRVQPKRGDPMRDVAIHQLPEHVVAGRGIERVEVTFSLDGGLALAVLAADEQAARAHVGVVDRLSLDVRPHRHRALDACNHQRCRQNAALKRRLQAGVAHPSWPAAPPWPSGSASTPSCDAAPRGRRRSANRPRAPSGGSRRR